jgi:ankyrin repeat protein
LLRYVDVDCRDSLGRTALHAWAETGGSLEVFALLAYRGSANLDPQAQDGTTPFLLAAIHQNKVSMVTLYYASRMRKLININAQNAHGFTALHVAVMSHNTELIDLLLSMHADWSIADHDGRTPYELARRLGL